MKDQRPTSHLERTQLGPQKLIYNCIFVMLFCKKLCLVFEHNLFTYSSHLCHLFLAHDRVKAEYVRAADRLMAILAEEGIARLPCVKPQAWSAFGALLYTFSFLFIPFPSLFKYHKTNSQR